MINGISARDNLNHESFILQDKVWVKQQIKIWNIAYNLRYKFAKEKFCVPVRKAVQKMYKIMYRMFCDSKIWILRNVLDGMSWKPHWQQSTNLLPICFLSIGLYSRLNITFSQYNSFFRLCRSWVNISKSFYANA